MSATVADLNPETLENAKRQFVELYGSALVLNTYLKIAVALISLVALGLLALNFRTVSKYANVKPLVIRIDDVGLFYRVYDAAGSRPTAEQLQRDYLDVGSDGLHTFAKIRNITGANMAATLAKTPAIYSDARLCAAVLPAVRERLSVAMARLASLYPSARFPPVTVAVGRGRPVAAGGPTDGVMVGLEALCGVKYFDANVEDRFVHVIAHEYIHVQQ